MKTSKLTGAALNWAVAKAEGELPRVLGNHTVTEFEAGLRRYLITITAEVHDDIKVYAPSTNWAQGGQIIEREGIDVYCTLIGRPDHEKISWQKSNWRARYSRMGIGSDASFGHSALEAAMRCYCCSKLGDEIEIPEELL